ncbi:MAG: ABC transporter permease subunit [Planctomycetota bacterium]
MSEPNEPNDIDYADPATADVAPQRRKRRTSLVSRGQPMVWLTGGCVAVALLMTVTLLGFVLLQGLGTFWPQPVVQVSTTDGDTLLGIPSRAVDKADGTGQEILYRVGNFDVTGERFKYVREDAIAETNEPEWALTVERLENGIAIGYLDAIIHDGVRTEGRAEAWAKFQELYPQARAIFAKLKELEEYEIGGLADEEEVVRLKLRSVELEHGEGSTEYRQAVADAQPALEEMAARFTELNAERRELEDELAKFRMEMRTEAGVIVPNDPLYPDEPMMLHRVVRAFPANQLGTLDKVGIYFGRWWEYLTDVPREANSEGGIWPAIVGTVMLTFIMILVVLPIGVIAAIYLREYARQGLIVSVIRICVNNLAGVPSIVYGVFGLGFFCYTVGKWIDGGPEHAGFGHASAGGWWAGIGVAILLVAAAVVVGILGGRMGKSDKVGGEWQTRALGFATFFLWAGAVVTLGWLLATIPFFDGFHRAKLPDPTVGKSAMIWASLTLALLTLPVIIVSTEEALAAVPNSMREGSYACGASKWQTIRRIVLPRALPGIMTGMILAIARGTGEVAPLMLVGAVKLAPELPVAADFPYFGTNRSFMHLGFHVFDLGFQSPDSEAARPLLFTTVLVLIAIVVFLNITAIFIRSRLRRAFAGGAF